jgi:hypothetical protein
MAKKLSPLDVSKPYNPPRLPASPIKAAVKEQARRDTPSVDSRNLHAGAEGMSARELSTITRGPLVNDLDTGRQFIKDIRSRPRRQWFSRNYTKNPLQLKGSRSLGGKR